jgi:hypothetical protein
MKISAVAGTAFVDFSEADVLTDYLGRKLTITDSAGKKLVGYIKAAGTGETLDSELVTGGDFSNAGDWTCDAGWGVTGGKAIATSVSGKRIYQAYSYTIGILVKYIVVIDSISGGYIYGIIGGAIGISPITSGTKTEYLCTTASGNTRITGTAASIQLDSVSIKQVLTPSATGVTIVSTSGGTTYNWASVESGFNYNDASSYTYEIEARKIYSGPFR